MFVNVALSVEVESCGHLLATCIVYVCNFSQIFAVLLPNYYLYQGCYVFIGICLFDC